MKALSDAELVALFKEYREQDAFTEIDRRYRRKLVRVVKFRVGDIGTAEDIVQRAFVRLYTRIDEFDAERGLLERWLISMTLNLMRDERRSRKAKRRDGGTCWPLDSTKVADPSTFTAEEQLIHAEQRAALREFIFTLPDDLRQAFLFIYAERLSYREAEARSGVSRAALAGRVRRAENLLREAFPDLSPDTPRLLDVFQDCPLKESA